MTPVELLSLPQPALSGPMSVEAALAQRRTKRSFNPQPLNLAQVGQLLWSAAGITDFDAAKRAAPSAGARYPLELYAVLPDGLYHYEPGDHRLRLIRDRDLRGQLAAAASQEFIAQAPCTIAIAADYGRTTARYGQRGSYRYVPMDVGHAAQNVLLQATALGLAAVPVGAFDDQQVSQVLGLPEHETPLYLLPVGRPAG